MKNPWEKEYQQSKLITKDDKPQHSVLKFLRFLKKQGVDLEGKTVLDLGCGTGRNSLYVVKEKGMHAIGYDISKTAIHIARKVARDSNLNNVQFDIRSIGEPYPLQDNTIDLILDVTSSNALTETERELYLAECFRVLKPEGHMFVRALAKDGDVNAKKLIKQFPGPEKDTYIMPGLGLTERVFTREDILALYRRYFEVLHIDKTTGYSQIEERMYKRNFFLLYLKKM